MKQKLKLDADCKKGKEFIINLVKAFKEYDLLNNDITMRAFSSKCYNNTKVFENEIRDTFLKIAYKYNPEFQNICNNSDLNIRDKLAYFGIYARPEIYEFSGDISIITNRGELNFSAFGNCGAAVRSTFLPVIKEVNMSNIVKVIFIENKTNYDEYISSENNSRTLIIYHGGFMSPNKRRFISTIFNNANKNTEFFFWADIDLGGFEMFNKLQEIISNLKPLNMSAKEVQKYHKYGYPRNEKYLSKLDEAKNSNKYPPFADTIDMILKYGVTIEQEAFLLC